MIVRIYLLQLKPNETLSYRNKRIKVIALVRYVALLCWPCSNDMYSPNVNLLMKNVIDKNSFNTKMGAWYKRLQVSSGCVFPCLHETAKLKNQFNFVT